MSGEYEVVWRIDDGGARSPREAAEYALEMQRDPESTATVFEVFEVDTGNAWKVDLTEGWVEPMPWSDSGTARSLQESGDCAKVEDLEAERFPSYSEVRRERLRGKERG